MPRAPIDSTILDRCASDMDDEAIKHDTYAEKMALAGWDDLAAKYREKASAARRQAARFRVNEAR